MVGPVRVITRAQSDVSPVKWGAIHTQTFRGYIPPGHLLDRAISLPVCLSYMKYVSQLLLGRIPKQNQNDRSMNTEN